MEVIVIESEAFKRLEYLIERVAQLGKEQDVIMSLEEAAEYLRVDKQWVYSRRRKIGFIQEGKVLRLRKSAIDKFLDTLTVKPKVNNITNTRKP